MDARNWSNRSACYAKKGWYEQALYDAEHACSLQPEWYKVWYRKSVAYMGLGRYEEAGKAGREGLKYAQGESEVGILRQLVKKADDALLLVKKRRENTKNNSSKVSVSADITSNSDGNKRNRNGGVHCVNSNNNQNNNNKEKREKNNRNKDDGTRDKSDKDDALRTQQETRMIDDIREDVKLMRKQLDSLTMVVSSLEATIRQFMEKEMYGEKIKATYVQEKEEIIDSIVSDGKHENYCDEDEGSSDACDYRQQEENDHDDEQHEEGSTGKQLEDKTVPLNGNDDSCSDHSDDIENEIESMEAAWKDVVQDARALLGLKGSGFVPPPEKRKRTDSRIPSFLKNGETKLSIDSLGSLFDGLNVSKKSNIDPTGVERFACSTCSNECAKYVNPNLNPEKERILIPNALQDSCDSCGCHFAEHSIFPNVNGKDAIHSEDGPIDDASEETEAPSPCAKEEAIKDNISRNYSSSSESHIDLERKRRIQNAIERKEMAERNGELIVETTADILSQKERLACTSCTECPGFKIIYHTSDANNPDVMFYCSLCGCPSDDHAVDQTWQAAETRRKQAEEAQAAARAARQRQWNRSRTNPNKIQSAYDALNIPFGSSKSVITRAYKKAALQYHPDKQPRSLSYEELVKRQEKFHQITAAYRSLSD